MKKRPNVLFLPVRSPTLTPKEWVERINNSIFPNDNWNISVLIRKPMLMKGYKNNIFPIDMYSDKIYRRKLTKKQIEEAENWLGYSFDSIIYMEYLRYHTKFKPKAKDRENVAKHVLYFKKILKEKNIDFASICFPNDVLNITMHYVLKKMNIPSFNLIKFHKGPKIIDGKLFDLIVDTLPVKLNKLSFKKNEINKIYNEQRALLLGRTDSLYGFIKKRNKKNFSFSFNTAFTKIKQLFRIIMHQSKYESAFRVSDMVKVYLKNFINSNLNRHLFSKRLYEEIPMAHFYYFPIHFQKDYQISFRESFINQLELIKMIARSLPFNTKLVIKSHPHFVGSDYSYKEFRKIKKIPNVVLVHYKEDSIGLIKKSIGVITINSTAGYEAVILNKPVVTFGNEFYTQKDVAIKIEDMKELPSILLNVKLNPKYNVDLNARKRMVYEYNKNAFKLDTNFITDKNLDEKDKKTIMSKYKQLEDYFRKIKK